MDRRRNRNIALVLIGAGVFLLLNGHHFGFFTAVALFLLLYGVHKVRTGFVRKGYIFMSVGLLLLFGGNLSLLLAVVLISLGWFYLKARQVHHSETHYRKQSLIENIRWGREPWILRDMSIWHLIGEIQMDFTYAIPDRKETTIVIQGVIADIDFIIPEHVGLSVTSSVLLGQTNVGTDKQAGLLNRIEWQSPNYWSAEQQVKLVISYVVADVDIKIV